MQYPSQPWLTLLLLGACSGAPPERSEQEPLPETHTGTAETASFPTSVTLQGTASTGLTSSGPTGTSGHTGVQRTMAPTGATGSHETAGPWLETGASCDAIALFDDKCGGCHNPVFVSTGFTDLDLISPDVADRLVGIDRTIDTPCDAGPRINPWNPADSFLLRVLDPLLQPDACGAGLSFAMPSGAPALEPDELQCVRDWVFEVASPAHTGESGPLVHTGIPETGDTGLLVLPPVDGPAVLGRIKMLLTGGAVTEAEYTAAIIESGAETPMLDEAVLAQQIETWMDSEAHQRKLASFLRVELQQGSTKITDYSPQFENFSENPLPLGSDVDRFHMAQNADEMFVRTALRIVADDQPITEFYTTNEWEVTTAGLVALLVMAEDGRGVVREYQDLEEHPTDPTLPGPDYEDWRTITLEYGGTASHDSETDIVAIRALTDGQSITTRLPRNGFFTAPGFFAAWPTTTDNHFRITASQTVLAGLGLPFSLTDPTVGLWPTSVDEAHAEPGSPCAACHGQLDPMRMAFANHFTEAYQAPLASTFLGTAGFAFHGHVVDPIPMPLDLGEAMTTHPEFAAAWVQKVCRWANGEACDATDPAFQEATAEFAANGYRLRSLLAHMLASPLVLHAKHSSDSLPILRRNHFCNALETRIAAAATTVGIEPPLSPCLGAGEALADSMAADRFARGAVGPMQPHDPTPVSLATRETICSSGALELVGAPGSSKLLTTEDVPAAIELLVTEIMGLPPSHPRYPPAQEVLTQFFDVLVHEDACGADFVEEDLVDVQCGLGLDPEEALAETFAMACSSPELAAGGL